MNIKAARDVLDYKGKHWIETAETEIEAQNFNPEKIMREIVETGDFKADISKMECPKFKYGVESDIMSRFSKGYAFQWPMYGISRMLACDFLPIGLQYVMHDRSRRIRGWVRTDTDLMSKPEQK